MATNNIHDNRPNANLLLLWLRLVIVIAGSSIFHLRAVESFTTKSLHFSSPSSASRFFSSSFPSFWTTSYMRRNDNGNNYNDSNDDDDDDEEEGVKKEEEDWRAFRARLVQNSISTLSTTSTTATATSSTSSTAPAASEVSAAAVASGAASWAYNAHGLVEPGTLLVSVPTTDLCQGLEQQYWHRCVVLVTHVNCPGANDMGESWEAGCIRGLLLNRPTNYHHPPHNRQQSSSSSSSSSVLGGTHPDTTSSSSCYLYGGQLAGFTKNEDDYGRLQEPEFVCLHTLQTPDAKAVSHSIFATGSTNDNENDATNNNDDHNHHLYWTTLTQAEELLINSNNNSDDTTRISPQDFTTVGGYCLWRPGQLEIEMGPERREWITVSMDETSIFHEIQTMQEEIIAGSLSIAVAEKKEHHPTINFIPYGTKMWERILHKIDLGTDGAATDRLPAGQLVFYDRMLAKWGSEHLSFLNPLAPQKQNHANNSNSSSNNNNNTLQYPDSSSLLQRGTILRSICHKDHFLLLEQELHRSVILLMEETAEGSMGIMLNQPTMSSIEIMEGVELPLRYGGPLDYWGAMQGTGTSSSSSSSSIDVVGKNNDDDDDDDDDDESYYADEPVFIWIHNSRELAQKMGVVDGGKTTTNATATVTKPASLRLPPSQEAPYWFLSGEEAIVAIQSGFLSPTNVMVFGGCCVWEKEATLGKVGGGLREQIDILEAFEVVETTTSSSNSKVLWEMMHQQTVLSEHTLRSNVQLSIQAWEALSPLPTDADILTTLIDDEATGADDDDDDLVLADAALLAWVVVHLLYEPLTTLVEVDDGLV